MLMPAEPCNKHSIDNVDVLTGVVACLAMKNITELVTRDQGLEKAFEALEVDVFRLLDEWPEIGIELDPIFRDPAHGSSLEIDRMIFEGQRLSLLSRPRPGSHKLEITVKKSEVDELLAGLPADEKFYHELTNRFLGYYSGNLFERGYSAWLVLLGLAKTEKFPFVEKDLAAIIVELCDKNPDLNDFLPTSRRGELEWPICPVVDQAINRMFRNKQLTRTASGWGLAVQADGLFTQGRRELEGHEISIIARSYSLFSELVARCVA